MSVRTMLDLKDSEAGWRGERRRQPIAMRMTESWATPFSTITRTVFTVLRSVLQAL